MPKSKALIKINPREPLTHKAKKAIEQYALTRCDGLTISCLLIKYTLEAERMKRAQLYAWLEAYGFTWRAQYSTWSKDAKESH